MKVRKLDYLEGLTEAQRAAVEHHTGPALIVAGPGSGKTRTLTHRIAHLLAVHKVSPNRIVAVTFTNKAAQEMKERVGKMLPGNLASKLKISTFHSLCARILRSQAEAAGLARNFTISDEDDAKAYVIQAIAVITNKEPKEVKAWTDYRKPVRVRKFISMKKQQVITASEYTDNLMERGDAKPSEVFYSQVYTKYEEILRRNRAVDFDDLIMITVRLFNGNEEVRNKYATATEQLLVDESQDTNLSQYALAEHLSSVHGNIMMVGDHDQSIYAFRGAEPENIQRMRRKHGDKLSIYFLEENFRSTPQIADVANRVIENNPGREDKIIRAVAENGKAVRCLECMDPNQEAGAIIDEIISEVRAKRARYKDFALLYRIHAKSRIFEEMLVTSNVPHKVIGGMGFYNRAVVKDMISYLKLVQNGADEASFIRIYNKPPRGFGDTSYAKIHALVDEDEIPIMDVFRKKYYEGVLKGQGLRGAKNIRETFKALHALSRKEVGPLIETAAKKSGYIHYLEKDVSEKGLSKREHLEELIAAAREFDRQQGAGLLRFLEWTSLMQSADEEVEEDAVTLMTCHAAKGLEFPRLYIVGAEDGMMPIVKEEDDFGRLKSSGQIEKDLQEERRIFFVALTRAERELTVSYARTGFRYNQTVDYVPSRFIREMGPHVEHESLIGTPAGSYLIGMMNKRKRRGKPRKKW